MEQVLNSVYQPIVNIQNHEILYYESLARVKGDDLGRHVKLIEAGESFGFIDLIDIEMLRKAIKTARNNPGIKIAVNISVMTIENALGDVLACAFQNHNVMSQIVFEITETVKLRKPEMMHKFVTATKLIGAKIAIDDYGDGFSDMDLVHLVQPDFVKLPKTYIENAINTNDGSAFKFVHELMRKNKIEIIAEHIDTDAKLLWLHDAGIKHAQGFIFGKFVDEDKLTFNWSIRRNQSVLNKLIA